MVELTTEYLGFIIPVIVGTVSVALYVERLHWKINKLEEQIKKNPLLSALDTYQKDKGIQDFFDSILKYGRVESI